MRHIGKLVVFILLLAGCAETFDSPPQAVVGTTIAYSDTTGTSDDTIYVSVNGIGQDSILADSSDISDDFSLPLSTGTQDSFIFTFNSVQDTITISHDNTLMVEDAESGFYYEYLITGIAYSKNQIDSVAISDSTVTTTWNENIQIYLNSLPDSTSADQ